MVFWGLVIFLAGIVAMGISRPLWRETAPVARRAAHDMQVYRDQLSAIENDISRGVLNPQEAESSRTEVARRLLAASDEAKSEIAGVQAPRSASKILVAVLLFALMVLATGLYSRIGQPGYTNRPLAERRAEVAREHAARPTQADAEAMVAASPGNAMRLPPANPEHLALVQELKALLAERPDDLEGYQLLVDNLARLGQWGEAHEAQSRVIEILGPNATGEDYVELSELMILAVNGFVSPEAERALREAMLRVPRDPRARYYSGLVQAQAGRPDLAYAYWVRLLEEGPESAPWVQAIRPDIAEISRAAGMPEPAAPTVAGPSAADVEAAQSMSEADRAAMIEAMVANLSTRLATEGGPPEDWAKLIRAYGILGDSEQASAIWAEAQVVFEQDPSVIALLREAAQSAGVAE